MTSAQLKVYVGYDSREDIAWQVCRNSLLRHASRSVSVCPLRQPALRELGLYTRPLDNTGTTEFSLTRFLTPYIAAHDGWSIFVDCDFVFTADIFGLVDALDTCKAVHVVQHDYRPAQIAKMDGRKQTAYPRKNWSSFMVFNGMAPCVKALTPAVVNSMTAAYLHRFDWIHDENLLGALDLSWNFLVGEYPMPPRLPNAIHYTNGGPWFENCRDVDYSELWMAERDIVLAGSARPSRLEEARAPARSVRDSTARLAGRR